ncbi:MAG: DUF2723 domain-containing protein [Candidatus Sumerlaeota bacterium]
MGVSLRTAAILYDGPARGSGVGALMQRMTPAAFRNAAFGALAIIVGIIYFSAPYVLRLGDGLELTAVSVHLGVAHPSGYPLFTLLGWIAIHVLPVEPYTAMLIICRFAASASILFMAAGTRRLLLAFQFDHSISTLVAAIASLTIALSGAFRDTVIAVEVYALNALLLSVIVWLLLPIYDQVVNPRRLVMAGALAGFAAANHLTSLCVGPLFLIVAAMSIRKARNFAPAVLACSLYAVIPVVLYASFIFRAEQHHAILWGSPYSTEALFNHIRGGEYRNFQFLMQSPEHAFTIKTYGHFALERVLLFCYALGSVPFGPGATTFLSAGVLIVAFLCGAVNGIGLSYLRCHAVGLIAAIAAQIAFILTYNIPDISDYYLGIFILALPFSILGACVAARFALRRVLFPEPKIMTCIFAVTAAIAVLGLGKLIEWRRDGTENLVAKWLDAVTETLPPNAAVITSGDYDLYPLWYMQFAQKRRTDLFVFGGNFVRFPWFRQSLSPGDPRTAVVGFRPAPPTSLQQYIRDLREKVIDPILPYGPVYTTLPNPMERSQLSNYFRVTAVGTLVPDKDLLLAERLGLAAPPGILYKIEAFKK